MKGAPMIRWLLDRVQAVVSLGAERAPDSRVRRRIAICNASALAAAAVCLPYAVVYSWRAGWQLAVGQLVLTVLFLGPVGLSRAGRFKLARLWLVVVANCAIFLFAGMLSAASGLQTMFIATACLPLVLAATHERAFTAFGVLLPLLGWLLLEWLQFNLGFRIDVGANTLVVVHLLVIPSSFVGLLCQVAYFAAANERAEQSLEQSLGDLRVANQALKDEVAGRLQAEAELRQAHKLEAVGRLAAGVAHEINTPVQFVSDSIHFLSEAASTVMGLVPRLQRVRASVLDGTPSMDAAREVLEAEDDADLPYLAANIPEAFARCLEGLNRVATIVRSMKEFAHPDAAKMGEVDLNGSIESTLVIARSEYKYVAELQTSFGDLPPVTCNAGDINQAVLNIVVNAAHAIGDVVAGTEQKGLIKVQTRGDGSHVVISISDSGGGMSPEIRDRIFDPFFTTKAVGKGTGQGLAIARSVVVDGHHGELWFDTAVGEGTTFHIRLPVGQTFAAAA